MEKGGEKEFIPEIFQGDSYHPIYPDSEGRTGWREKVFSQELTVLPVGREVAGERKLSFYQDGQKNKPAPARPSAEQQRIREIKDLLRGFSR